MSHSRRRGPEPRPRVISLLSFDMNKFHFRRDGHPLWRTFVILALASHGSSAHSPRAYLCFLKRSQHRICLPEAPAETGWSRATSASLFVSLFALAFIQAVFGVSPGVPVTSVEPGWIPLSRAGLSRIRWRLARAHIHALHPRCGYTKLARIIPYP